MGRRCSPVLDVVLSYIEEIPDRMAVLDALLDLRVRRDDPTKVVTSVLSVTEVAYAQAEKGAAALDPVVLARIDDFWADREAILLAEFHDLIAREARDLIRSAVAHGWSLRANDAVHLATAKRLGVAEFHTYDKRLDKYAEIVGFPIVRPRTLQPRML
ncbi:MAG TPA: PIN domain-containing protein [Chloroflexota bacterium]|nr:PIN domain-containing protein [Chloroflexota bacterium]